MCRPDTCKSVQVRPPSTMTTTRHLSAFPLDILEHIIDMLHSDPASLCVLSLTCRILLPRSRYHRLRSISFKFQHEIHSFNEILKQRPRLKRLIFAITLGGEVDAFTPSHFSMISQLHNLHTLTISMVSREFSHPSPYISFHPSLLKVIRTSVTSIKTLYLQGIYFKSPVEFGGILMAFPRLHALRFTTPHFGSSSRYPPVPSRPPPITQLTVSVGYSVSTNSVNVA